MNFYSLLQLSSREALIMKRTQMRSELTWQLSRLQSAKDDLDKMKNVNQLKSEFCSIEKHYSEMKFFLWSADFFFFE
jgi:hypothetical protein